MGYIIVFRSRHRDPFIDLDSHDFKEDYSTFEDAKKAADEIIQDEGPKSEWYYDYQIYQEVES